MKNFKMENGNLVEIGEIYRFADLWSGDGDEQELLESGSVCVGIDKNYMPVVAAFDVIDVDVDNIILTLVKVTDIY